ncbi:MAG: YggS family pyridoxal phosphate-dependent enzyme [bacterium]|nr:YggS family pyridoxal phosphate-dependent enzyme [bacterium]
MIKENLERIRREVPEYVEIIGAVKTRTPDEIKELIDAGITIIGHNYVQEAEDTFEELGEYSGRVQWHMIGHLQKNKINKALKIFNMIQTVDSFGCAEEISSRSEKINKVMPILLEVNIGEESSKTGIEPDYRVILETVQKISLLSGVSLKGLMTMGPLTSDPKLLIPYFKNTRLIFDRLNSERVDNLNLKILSMGMSDSYKIAIDEGSTMIRLGTILFGARHKKTTL